MALAAACAVGLAAAAFAVPAPPGPRYLWAVVPSSPAFDYDVAIVGAGPAGAACALALRTSGLRVALLDKARFPRDKVCGDAIPGQAFKALRQLDPAFVEALWQLQPRDDVRDSRLVASNGASLTLQWTLPSFNSPREMFDAALLDLVRKHSATEILEKTGLKTLSIEPGHARLTTTDGREITVRLVIGCDGANSVDAFSCSQ